MCCIASSARLCLASVCKVVKVHLLQFQVFEFLSAIYTIFDHIFFRLFGSFESSDSHSFYITSGKKVHMKNSLNVNDFEQKSFQTDLKFFLNTNLRM